MKYLTLEMGLMFVVSLLLACQPGAVAEMSEVRSMSVATEEVGVTKEVVLSPPPSPTPVTCTPLPEDMALRVEPVSSMTVWGEIEGLQPGEKPIVIFRTEAPGRWLRTVVGPFKPVGSKGRLTFRQTGLDPLRGATTNRWEVKVVHARGVACTEVTLP